MSNFVEIAENLGKLVQEKNRAYGNSFVRSGDILTVLYPAGIKPEQFVDALLIVRVIDKLFRIANQKDAFHENPWQDIAGYGLCGVSKGKHCETHKTEQVVVEAVKEPAEEPQDETQEEPQELIKSCPNCGHIPFKRKTGKRLHCINGCSYSGTEFTEEEWEELGNTVE
jgi:hypothetical protein